MAAEGERGMSTASNDTEQSQPVGWPIEFWAVVVPGLILLLPAGAEHLAGRLERVLRQMSIQADMVSAYLPGMIVCAMLVSFLAFGGRREASVALRFLVWAILLAAAMLIADFLAAVAIQLAWPAAPTDFSEGWRVVLQAVILVPYLIWMVREYRKLLVADSVRGDTAV